MSNVSNEHQTEGGSPADPMSSAVSRRQLLQYSAVGALGFATSGLLAACGSSSSSTAAAGGGHGAIQLPVILDETGPLNPYCLPQIAAIKLAIEDINSKGGLLGRNVALAFRDGQSAQDTYVEFANETLPLASTSTIIGAVSSASREAMRPVVDRYRKPYIYPALYEGGVCDTYTYIRGLTPSQQLKLALIPWAAQNLGKKMYILAADYIAGHVYAQWAQIYGNANGIKTVGVDFVPLTVTQFQSLVTKVQSSGADFVFSVLVGADHLNFYPQFASAGLAGKVKIVSPVFGLGNEQLVLAPEAAQGIVTALDYFQELSNPTNTQFVALWRKKYGNQFKYVTDYAVLAWDSVQIWAEAVRKANSVDPDKIRQALDSGLSLESPAGSIALQPATHHFVLPVHLAQVNGSHSFDILKSFDGVAPAYEEQVCNLVKSPGTQKQFIPKT